MSENARTPREQRIATLTHAAAALQTPVPRRTALASSWSGVGDAIVPM